MMTLYEELWCSLNLLQHFATVEKQLYLFIDDEYKSDFITIDHLLDWREDKSESYAFANYLYMRWFLSVDILKLKNNTYTAYCDAIDKLKYMSDLYLEKNVL